MLTLCYHLRNCQTILQSGCIILHSHQQYMRVLIFPHFCQQVGLKGSPFSIMSMCSSLELVNVGKRVFFSDIINFKMLRPWVDPKSNDKCPYERDTEERPKRRESRRHRLGRRAQFKEYLWPAEEAMNGFRFPSNLWRECCQHLDFGLLVLWIVAIFLLGSCLQPLPPPVQPPNTSCQRSCPGAQLWVWYVCLKNVQWLLLPRW